MRLWSVHPRHLDGPGLVALWREGLLAKAVLAGLTQGYRHHPQLARFRAARRPVAVMNVYLAAVHAEATRRGYRFDGRKLAGPRSRARLVVPRGQVAHEWQHLLRKLRGRSPADYAIARGIARPRVHPLFVLREGPVAPWERI